MAKENTVYELFNKGKIIFPKVKDWNYERQIEYLENSMLDRNLGTFMFKENKNGDLIVLKGKKKLLTFHLYLNILLKNIAEYRKINQSEIEIFERYIKHDYNYKIEFKDQFANQFYKDFVVDNLPYQLPKNNQEYVLRNFYENIHRFSKEFWNAELILDTLKHTKIKFIINK